MAGKQEKQMGFFEILEIGKTLEKQLVSLDNKERNELKIYVDEESFNKIDEDIYYRQFPDGKDFKPSDDTIFVNFEFIRIVISKKKKETK